MLSEQFIASIGEPEKAPSTNIIKDAAIFLHEFQPLRTQRSVFKKSATPPNCLALSESHIFAAQADKAVVNVYSRVHGNLEATVPFTERVTCLALACQDTVLVMGTNEGRLFLWETSSGRQVSTPQAHLQTVTRVVLDPTGEFILSASEDSTIHIWPLIALLSFSTSGLGPHLPIRTFTSHRTGITALELGHSSSFSNFAVSTSKDRTCLIWDYHNNSVLRTYLLPDVPTCVAVDAADRAIYVGYEDGSVQKLDLYTSTLGKGTSVAASADRAAPMQPPPSARWQGQDKSVGAVRSITLSFDSCTFLTGHDSGNVLMWDIAWNGLASNVLQAPLPGPVNNLKFLPVFGYQDRPSECTVRKLSIVKPKFGAFDSASGQVPGTYVQNVQLVGDGTGRQHSSFSQALSSHAFQISILDEGLQELQRNRKGDQASGAQDEAAAEDFVAFEDSTRPRHLSLEDQNAALKSELEALRRLQAASLDKIDRINSEKKALLDREQKRLHRGSRIPINGAGDAGFGVEDSMSNDE